MRARSLVDGVADWARRYPLAPRYDLSAPGVERIHVTAADGVPLAGVHLAPALGADGPPITFVVVHGFTNSTRSPGIFRFVQALRAHGAVTAIDLRGHGRSGGRCAYGVDEPLDVEAAVADARTRTPGSRIVTIGSSLGGAIVLLHAGIHHGVHGVVAVSPPAWSSADDRPGGASAQRAIRSPVGRLALRVGTGVRLPPTCGVVPDSSSVVAAIAPAFMLLVHDPEDRYFGPEHCETLERWARPPVERWIRPGRGHGTDLLDADLARDVARHASG